MTKNSKPLSIHEATDKIMTVLNAEKGGRPTRADAPQRQASGRSAAGREVGRWLANALGIPPELATAGGAQAYAAMMALQHARDAGGGGVRQKHLVTAQRHMAKLDPARHGPLIQHLQGTMIALGGRGGDTHIAHVTPGEIVVPRDMQTPDMLAFLYQAARAQGIDPARIQVASGQNSINPRTGQMEFAGPDDEEIPNQGAVPNVPGNPDLGPNIAIPPGVSLAGNMQEATTCRRGSIHRIG